MCATPPPSAKALRSRTLIEARSPVSNPLHALEIAAREIRSALEVDNTELAMAYLPVVDWAIEELATAYDTLTRTAQRDQVA